MTTRSQDTSAEAAKTLEIENSAALESKPQESETTESTPPTEKQEISKASSSSESVVSKAEEEKNQESKSSESKIKSAETNDPETSEVSESASESPIPLKQASESFPKTQRKKVELVEFVEPSETLSKSKAKKPHSKKKVPVVPVIVQDSESEETTESESSESESEEEAKAVLKPVTQVDKSNSLKLPVSKRLEFKGTQPRRFLQKFEILIEGNHLSDRQKCKTILLYIDNQTHLNIIEQTDGFKPKNWNLFKENFLQEFVDESMPKYRRTDLDSFIERYDYNKLSGLSEITEFYHKFSLISGDLKKKEMIDSSEELRKFKAAIEPKILAKLQRGRSARKAVTGEVVRQNVKSFMQDLRKLYAYDDEDDEEDYETKPVKSSKAKKNIKKNERSDSSSESQDSDYEAIRNASTRRKHDKVKVTADVPEKSEETKELIKIVKGLTSKIDQLQEKHDYEINAAEFRRSDQEFKTGRREERFENKENRPKRDRPPHLESRGSDSDQHLICWYCRGEHFKSDCKALAEDQKSGFIFIDRRGLVHLNSTGEQCPYRSREHQREWVNQADQAYADYSREVKGKGRREIEPPHASTSGRKNNECNGLAYTYQESSTSKTSVISAQDTVKNEEIELSQSQINELYGTPSDEFLGVESHGVNCTKVESIVEKEEVIVPHSAVEEKVKTIQGSRSVQESALDKLKSAGIITAMQKNEIDLNQGNVSENILNSKIEISVNDIINLFSTENEAQEVFFDSAEFPTKANEALDQNLDQLSNSESMKVNATSVDESNHRVECLNVSLESTQAAESVETNRGDPRSVKMETQNPLVEVRERIPYSAPLMTVKTTIEGTLIEALVDGGSQISIMSRKTFEKLGLPLMTRGDHYLTGVDGINTLLDGICEAVNVEIHGVSTRTHIYVTPNSNWELILGAPFLRIAEAEFKYSRDGTVAMLLGTFEENNAVEIEVTSVKEKCLFEIHVAEHTQGTQSIGRFEYASQVVTINGVERELEVQKDEKSVEIS